MSCRLETEEGKFNVTIEREQGRSFLVTRRMGPAGEALISALTPEQVVRMVLNREYRGMGPEAAPGPGKTPGDEDAGGEK